jgi:hypothetical protein
MKLSREMLDRLLNHLVSEQQDGLGDHQSERLSSLEIDDELEFCGLLHGQIGLLLALEDSVDISSDNRTEQLADTGGDSHR